MRKKNKVFTVKTLLWSTEGPFDFGQDNERRKHFLRLPHNFLNSPVVSNLNKAEKLVLLYILNCNSMYNEATTNIHRSDIQATLKCNRTDIEATMNVLRDFQLIEIIEEKIPKVSKKVSKKVRKRATSSPKAKDLKTLDLPKKKVERNKPELFELPFDNLDATKSALSDKYEHWRDKVYWNDEWLEERILAALDWNYSDKKGKPKRSKTGWEQFFSNWINSSFKSQEPPPKPEYVAHRYDKLIEDSKAYYAENPDAD